MGRLRMRVVMVAAGLVALASCGTASGVTIGSTTVAPPGPEPAPAPAVTAADVAFAPADGLDGRSAPAAAPPATTAPPTTAPPPPPPPPPATTAPPPPPATAAPAPAPAAAPAPTPAPAPAALPQEAIGRIVIPKLGIDTAMYEGIEMPILDRGPGWWPGTARPGQVGNVVVAGHRVSHSRPFRHIDRLVPGDEVLFVMDGVTHRYAVTGHEIVLPTGVHILEQTPEPTATLFACHPPGSTRYRWVVKARLVTA